MELPKETCITCGSTNLDRSDSAYVICNDCNECTDHCDYNKSFEERYNLLRTAYLNLAAAFDNIN